MLYLTGFYGSSVAWVEVDELGRAIYQLNTAVF